MTSILLQQGIAIGAAKQNNLTLLFESLAVIESSLQIMSAELNQLTEIAALQSENFELKTSSVLLEPLMVSAIALFRAQSERKRIAISLKINLDLQNVCVASNQAMLTSILINLISNAIKYSKVASNDCSPTIVISVESLSADRIQVSVADNGLGISEESLSKIWTPFFQVNNPERSRSKGYGLGLTHVQVAISRLAGHSVSCTSVLNLGSTFMIQLPVLTTNLKSYLSSSSPNFPIQEKIGDKKLILIVDDESTVRASLVTALNQVGYSTVAFATVLEACDLIRITKNRIHVLLVDYRLADGTAADIFRFLNEQLGDDSRRAPGLICLSGESVVDANFAYQFPSVNFLRRPVSSALLLEAVKLSQLSLIPKR